MIAYAAAADVARSFLAKINDAVLFPLITLLMGVALVVFLFGAFEYVQGADNPEARQKGQRHLLFGIIGLFVMVAAFTILSIAANTFGVDVPT